jgi:hypothetical protein
VTKQTEPKEKSISSETKISEDYPQPQAAN